MSHPGQGSEPPGRRPPSGAPAHQAGLRGWMERLRRLIGGGRQPPAAPPPAQGRAKGAAPPAVSLPASWQLPARPTAQVSYKRDRFGTGSTSRMKARERTIQRQVLLALAAVVSLGIAGAVVAVRSMSPGTLPMFVQGVWQTEGPRYRERLFELSRSRLAFQTSDSTADIYQIRTVRRIAGEETTTFEVEYEDQGSTYVFSFLYYAGPPEELRFVHQPFMVWTRTTGRGSLMPHAF